MTIKQAITRYIELRTNVLSPATIREYRCTLRRDFKDIESINILVIKNETIQRWINNLSLKRAPKTVMNIWSLLQTTLKTYVPSRCFRVRLPQRRKIRIIIPSDQSITQLINDCNSIELKTAIILASCMGLRRSEICALRWSDIYMKKHLIINKAAVIDPSRGITVKLPKTFSSDRILEIPENVTQYLEQVMYVIKPDSDDLIVPIRPNMLTDRFRSHKKRLGVNCRFHDLRHYYASVLLALEIPDIYAMELMGHSTPTMLKRVYQHTMEFKVKESTSKVCSYFSSKMSFHI